MLYVFFFSSRRRHTRLQGDWSSDVCSSDLAGAASAAPKKQTVVDQRDKQFVPYVTAVQVGTAVIFPNSDNIRQDRKSTRLNSSHLVISYAVFCLKKKTHDVTRHTLTRPSCR